MRRCNIGRCSSSASCEIGSTRPANQAGSSTLVAVRGDNKVEQIAGTTDPAGAIRALAMKRRRPGVRNAVRCRALLRHKASCAGPIWWAQSRMALRLVVCRRDCKNRLELVDATDHACSGARVQCPTQERHRLACSRKVTYILIGRALRGTSSLSAKLEAGLELEDDSRTAAAAQRGPVPGGVVGNPGGGSVSGPSRGNHHLNCSAAGRVRGRWWLLELSR